IDAAVAAWREAIAARADDRAAAGRVRDLVWAKVAPHLPASTRTLFVSADGALARLPWAALPGATAGSVLLDEFDGGLATVPPGLFLLDQSPAWPPALAARPPTAGLLALGDVAFGPPRPGGYAALPGTATELRALAPLHDGPATILRGADATPARLA